jgi:hypothetical protein
VLQLRSMVTVVAVPPFDLAAHPSRLVRHCKVPQHAPRRDFLSEQQDDDLR